MTDIKGIFYFCVLIFCVKSAGATCTFPGPIRDNWFSSDVGTLHFTDSVLWNYPVDLGYDEYAKLQNFSCESIDNGLYFLKSTSTFVVFADTFRAYLCIDFKQISATNFMYSIECAIEDHILKPVRIFIWYANHIVNASVACNRESPTDRSDFSTLVKEGAVGSELATATCPNDFLAAFSNFTVREVSGDNQCTGNSLDVCPDRTAMNYTYNSCSSTVQFSSGGYFYCLYYLTNSSTGVTYLHVYNNDSAVVSGDTYRIICYAFKKSGDIVYTTEYPGSCHINQNDIYVKSAGLITQYFSITKTCLGSDVVESDNQDWKYIVAIVCGVTGLAILMIVIRISIKKKLSVDKDLVQETTTSSSITTVQDVVVQNGTTTVQDVVESDILHWKYIVPIVFGSSGLVILPIVTGILFKTGLFIRFWSLFYKKCVNRGKVTPSEGDI